MAYDDSNERAFLNYPRHMLSFSGWTVPINLQAGAGNTGAGALMPAKPATRLIFINTSDGADEPATVTVSTLGGQTVQTVHIPPLTMSPPFNGHFTELTARGGTGAAGVSVIAFWAD